MRGAGTLRGDVTVGGSRKFECLPVRAFDIRDGTQRRIVVVVHGSRRVPALTRRHRALRVRSIEAVAYPAPLQPRRGWLGIRADRDVQLADLAAPVGELEALLDHRGPTARRVVTARRQ